MPTKKSSKKAPSFIDLRSDTVTLPTADMRRAMAESEVGDDVYAEDPTINKLEARAAEMFGREASIFVPSGTMGNQIAIKLHTRPGQEVICDGRAHILDWEMAMIGAFSGCIARTVPTPDGILSWELIAPRIRAKHYAFAQTGVIALENTHNMAGGTVYPTKVVNDICDHAHDAGIPVHMDGARIFNAAVALGRPVRELAAKPDSIMFCLSKGLGSPVGSMLVGDSDFIARARSVRKALGGGMRQAGVLAAAGLISLNKMVNRLKDDHANARFLAEGLAKIKGVRVNPRKVQTNIVVFELEQGTAADLSVKLRERGVLANPATSATSMRFVTHMNVDRAACKRALQVLSEALRS